MHNFIKNEKNKSNFSSIWNSILSFFYHVSQRYTYVSLFFHIKKSGEKKVSNLVYTLYEYARSRSKLSVYRYIIYTYTHFLVYKLRYVYLFLQEYTRQIDMQREKKKYTSKIKSNTIRARSDTKANLRLLCTFSLLFSALSSLACCICLSVVKKKNETSKETEAKYNTLK